MNGRSGSIVGPRMVVHGRVVSSRSVSAERNEPLSRDRLDLVDPLLCCASPSLPLVVVAFRSYHLLLLLLDRTICMADSQSTRSLLRVQRGHFGHAEANLQYYEAPFRLVAD